jgi:serine/threonine protein kinase
VGKEGIPKLLDFGIAKIPRDGQEQAATHTADRLATPTYASPEQIAGQPVTVAGNGIAGFSGDAGPAKQAQFNHPVSVAVDSSGNIYIARVGLWV